MIGKRLMIVLIAAAIVGSMASAVQAQLSAGRKAPDFTLPDLNDKNFKLSSFFVKPTKVVVLDLWATWCPPCRKEIPYLIDISKRYKAKGVVFVGVALDQDVSTVKDFVKEQKVSYRILHDPNSATVGSLYSVKPIPETYVIDKKGVIRYVHVGFGGDDAKKIEKEIKTLLAQK